jgi:hypothetical protein
MLSFEASSIIQADPAEVWAVLTDGPAWPTWNSAVVRFEGTIAPGHKVTVFPAVNPKRGFPVRVVEFTPDKHMTWRGGMPLGLFTGTRTFALTPRPDGALRFEMREEYTGPLAGLIGKSIPDLGPSFTQFADGLKEEAEKGGHLTGY